MSLIASARPVTSVDLNKGVRIELTIAEMFHAAIVGVRIRTEAIEHQRVDRYFSNPEISWRKEIGGALGECAASKATGRYWSGMGGGVGGTDVKGLQVRHTFHQAGHLYVYPSDRDDQLFVLVVGDAPVLRVVGYLPGAEAKRVGDLRASTYWVSQDALRPIEELRVE